MSSSAAWPEFESSATTKAPQWTLKTESDLHVERLEAKLESLKKKTERTSARKRREPHSQFPQEQAEPDTEDIQGGQEEADEGLWLLWNSNTAPGMSVKQKDVIARTQTLSSYGGVHDSGSQTEDSISEQEALEEREERLESAKAKAKHVEEYVAKERTCSRTCCCVIS
ncbi:hypothetical protein BGZ67_010406 [Mortierella alpina]|nr:hypothetical protein BGZ67_010406 [Mortierella alpina]